MGSACGDNSAPYTHNRNDNSVQKGRYRRRSDEYPVSAVGDIRFLPEFYDGTYKLNKKNEQPMKDCSFCVIQFLGEY